MINGERANKTRSDKVCFLKVLMIIMFSWFCFWRIFPLTYRHLCGDGLFPWSLDPRWRAPTEKRTCCRSWWTSFPVGWRPGRWLPVSTGAFCDCLPRWCRFRVCTGGPGRWGWPGRLGRERSLVLVIGTWGVCKEEKRWSSYLIIIKDRA